MDGNTLMLTGRAGELVWCEDEVRAVVGEGRCISTPRGAEVAANQVHVAANILSRCLTELFCAYSLRRFAVRHVSRSVQRCLILGHRSSAEAEADSLILAAELAENPRHSSIAVLRHFVPHRALQRRRRDPS